MSELKRLWDNYEPLFSVRKSDKQKFVVAAATREGFRCINIREFYLNKYGQWRPSLHGIVIPIKAPLNKGEKFVAPVTSMIKALTKAQEVAATMDLMDETKARWGGTKPIGGTKK